MPRSKGKWKQIFQLNEREIGFSCSYAKETVHSSLESKDKNKNKRCHYSSALYTVMDDVI